MSSSVERLGGGTGEPIFFQAFNHDDGEVYQGLQHNSRISSASSPPFVCNVNSSLHNLSPCSSALCARNPNYSTLSNPIQQQQAFSLTLSHPRPKTSAVAVTLGPFAGYLTALNWSRFLDAARQLLEEMSDFTRGVGLATDRGAREALSIDSELVVGFVRGSPAEVCAEERQLTKARLISMINEVCTKYMLYFQQVQAVIESFRLVAGLGNASPCISMALKSMSKHFKNVKNMITHQLERINKALGKQSFNKTETCGFGFANVEHGNAGGHGLSVRAQSHIWRSQRGLPERAVAVLRAWLFEHFLHPYPTDLDKQVLARQTGLTRNQVSNWFINARVRIWKPMVEEMHNMEMPQVRGAVVAAMSQLIDKQASQPSSSIAASSSKQPPKNGCIQKSCCQHLSSELVYIPHPAEEACSIVSYHDFPGKSNAVVLGNGGSGTGVSLTLGLKGNAGVSFPDRLLPSSSLFGFEECGDAYAFEGQDRSLVKDVDGHLRRHFVG